MKVDMPLNKETKSKNLMNIGDQQMPLVERQRVRHWNNEKKNLL